MSRHHMLPPLTYVQQPQPKKIEKRKSRIYAGDVDEIDEAAETHEATGARRATPAGSKLPPPNFPAIEGAERKPQNSGGRLSESTLTVMLQAQESK
ncbi:MAG: hypothetical protein ACXWKP_14695 [Bradyrhizobium sp.]